METTKTTCCVCGPIDQQNTLTQYFIPPDNYLSGISIKFGTYRRIMRHRVEFQLHLIDQDNQATFWFKHEVDAAGVTDINYFHLYFPTLFHSKGQLIRLTIASPDAKPTEAITAWLACNQLRIPGHVSSQAARWQGDADFGLQARLLYSNPEVCTDYPEGLLYSPYSSCNMNCTHCISRHSRRRAIYMSEKIKQDLVAHANAKKLKWLFTDYSGDIFFAERKNPGELDFLFNLGVALHIDSNGAYLDEATIERVMNSRVDALSISVDAAQDGLYQEIRIGAPSVDKIFESARMLVEARARHGRKHNFKISMGYTLMSSNLHQLPLFIQKAARAGVDSIGCRHLEVYHQEMETESLVHHVDYYNSMRAASIELARSLNIALLMPREELWEYTSSSDNDPCFIPWGSSVLLANGDVMACCVPGSKVGNVTEQSMEEIWAGKVYQQLRARVNSIDPPQLCKNCQFRNSLNKYDPKVGFCTRHAMPLLEELGADAKAE